MRQYTQATAQGARDYQEDRFGNLDLYAGTLLWVADGHGGDQASQAIHDEIKSAWILNDHSNPEEQIKGVFRALDARTETVYSGSTLSLVYLPKDKKFIYIGVVGDSPVIVRSGDKIYQGPDHNARTNPEERSQAIARGGVYAGGYVCTRYDGPGLQMTRALGDREMRFFLNQEPEIHILPFGQPGDWVLVATDGVIDPRHAKGKSEADVIAGLIDGGATAPELVSRAVKIPTHDNATAILVKVS